MACCSPPPTRSGRGRWSCGAECAGSGRRLSRGASDARSTSEVIERIVASMGHGETRAGMGAGPSDGDAAVDRATARRARRRRQPGIARRSTRMNSEIDVRDVLPDDPRADADRAPRRTTGHRRRGRRGTSPSTSRARGSSSCPGDDHVPCVGDSDAIVDEIEEFLTGARAGAEHRPRAGDRAVHRHRRLDRAGGARSATARGGSCSRAAPRAWSARELERFRGREIDTRATASSRPSTARRAPSAARAAIARRGADARARVRAGLHTGEVELTADDVGGIAVHIGAGSARWPAPARCWSPARSRTSSPARACMFEDRGARAEGRPRSLAPLPRGRFRRRRASPTRRSSSRCSPARVRKPSDQDCTRSM